TNVVSEAMKPEPHPSVRTWLNDQAAETLYLSSVTLAELLFGIIDMAKHQIGRKVVGAALAKATGGTSAAISAARGVGTLYRSSNAIQRG
ncbi:hypothetical protein NY98_24140, partial [Xanthomonas citri pv. fuscans]